MSRSSESESSAPSFDSPAGSMALVWAALAVALLALAGSLGMSIGLKLKACPLCLYQRTFVMGVVAVLGIGVMIKPRDGIGLRMIALPIAIGAFGIAVYHVYLEYTGKLECPAGYFGVGTAPQQSLAILTVQLFLISLSLMRGGPSVASRGLTVAMGIVMGFLFVVAAILSAPPMPAAPAKAYESLPDICRPPFRPGA